MIRVLVALWFAASTTVALAGPTADTLAAEATDLAAKGQHKDAAAKFAEAYRADPQRPELFCNIGISYYKAEEWARAHLILKLCIDRTALDQKFIDAFRPVIAAIEDTLGAGGHARVAIKVVPPGAQVSIAEWGPEETFAADRVIWLPAGTFHLTAKLDGFEPQTTEVVVGNTDRQDVSITLKKIEMPVPPPVEKLPSKIPAIASGVVTAGALVVTIIALRKAGDAADRGHFAVDREALDEDQSDVDKWNTITLLTGAVTVVGAAATTYLLIRARRSTSRVEVQASSKGAAAAYIRRF